MTRSEMDAKWTLLADLTTSSDNDFVTVAPNFLNDGGISQPKR
jgi:hypothetical protein